MSEHVIFTVEAEGLAYQALVDKSEGYPTAGVHWGKGRHVDLGKTPGPGWTIHHDELRKHPEKAQWAHAAVAPTAGKLTPEETAELEAKEAAAVELDATWKPEEPTDVSK